MEPITSSTIEPPTTSSYIRRINLLQAANFMWNGSESTDDEYGHETWYQRISQIPYRAQYFFTHSIPFAVANIWSNLVPLKKYIIINRDGLYSAVYITKEELNIFRSELKSLGSARQSQWYANIDKVKSISILPSLKRITLAELKHPDKDRRIAAVLPFQITTYRGQRGIVCERDELAEIMKQLDLIDSVNSHLFQKKPIPSRRTTQVDSSKLTGKEGDSISTYVDLESPAFSYFPTVFMATRYSNLHGSIIRRIGIHELLTKTLDFVKELSSESETFWLILDEDDCKQLGFYTISEGTEDFNDSFVRVQLSTLAFEQYVDSILKIDELLLDLLIFLDDNWFSNFDGFNFSVRHIRTKKITTQNGIIDRELLESAIYEAYFLSYCSSVINFENAERTSSRLRDLPKIPPNTIKYGINYLMNCLRAGYNSEQPRKLILESKENLHLYRNKGLLLSRFSRHFIKNILKDPIVLQPYKRKVKSVCESGYYVYTFSSWMWLTLLAGIIIPIVYAIPRIGKAPSEDIISAVAAIIASYVLVMSPLIFQIFYNGEQLKDVIANVRNIDTQEEFDRRKDHQLVDILQIIMKSKSPPKYLGGAHESNTSYIANEQQTDAFTAYQAMSFSNLELLGFGIYEDDQGELYMLDIWSCIYELSIVNHSEHYPSVEMFRKPGHYECLQKDHDFLEIHESMASFRCKASKNTYSIAGLEEDEYSGITSDIRSSNSETKPGYINVKFKSSTGREKDIRISRVLPFHIRRRRVEFSKDVFYRKKDNWANVRNTDLFDMSIGVELQSLTEHIELKKADSTFS